MFDNIIGPERPVSWVLQFWPVLVLSFVSSLVATSLCKKIALKFGIVDRPDNLVKTHKGSVAYLGGVGMLVGLTVGIFTGIYHIYDLQQFSAAFKWLMGVLGGKSVV